MSLLEDLRISHQWTQREVARRIDVSHMTYRRYEYGEEFPKKPALIALAKVYGMSPGELFDLLIGVKLPNNTTQPGKGTIMDKLIKERIVKVAVPAKIKEELANVISAQKKALESFITQEQIENFQESINKAIDLKSQALSAERFAEGIRYEIYFDNPIETMIEDAMQLQNELADKLQRQTLERSYPNDTTNTPPGGR